MNPGNHLRICQHDKLSGVVGPFTAVTVFTNASRVRCGVVDAQSSVEPDEMLLAPDNVVLRIPLVVQLHEATDALFLRAIQVEAIHEPALNTSRIVGGSAVRDRI